MIGGAETFRDLSELEELRRELDGRVEVGDMVSRSPLMRRMFEVLPQMAASDSTVLILGETGTGKELLARAMHARSPRSEGPFVAVNCGALPETLLESELFGYKAGAFTGADRDKPGRFALAAGGTLLLDEIGEMPRPAGEAAARAAGAGVSSRWARRRSVQADVRVVAATQQRSGRGDGAAARSARTSTTASTWCGWSSAAAPPRGGHSAAGGAVYRAFNRLQDGRCRDWR